MVLVGTFLKKVNVVNVCLASVAAVFVHWIVSDIGVVLYSVSIYPKTFGGYLTALIAAIPFERNLLVSNLVYGLFMFGIFEFAKSKMPELDFKKNQLQHS